MVEQVHDQRFGKSDLTLEIHMENIMRKLLSTIGLIIIFTSANTLLAQENDKLEKLKAAAESGDAKSQFEYGMELRKTDETKARIWVQRAADQDYAEAWYWLGYGWINDTSEYYEKAAELGYEPAFEEVFDKLLFRAGPKADVVKAKKFADLARQRHIKVSGYIGDDKYYGTIDACYDAGTFEIPKKDIPTKEDQQLYTDVNGQCLAYHEGLGVPKNNRNYLKCLLSDEDVDYNKVSEVYANGWGVEKNIKLAIALSCHASGVPAELMSVVHELQSMQNNPANNQTYRFCNNITSGYSGGRCAYDQEWIKTQRRLAKFSALTLKWPDEDKERFESALKAANHFFETRSGEEIDMSGTARAALAIEEESRLRDELLQNMKTFESGKAPKNLNMATEDKNLNLIYKKIMANKEFGEYGTINKKGVRTTQRTWLKYRDKFVDFAAKHYPNATKELWSAWITKQRTKQLADLNELFD